jgi:nitroreductase
MDFADVVRRRRMVRRFDDRPVPAAVLDRVLDAARRGPSAGFSQGFAFLVLDTPEATARYWDLALPRAERDQFPWPGLVTAPAVVLPLAHPQAYVDRYAEPDKAAAGLGASADAWPVPYWTVDTAFATMLLLLAAVDEGLGALFFGLFDREPAVRAEFGIPADLETIGVVALGWPHPDDRPSGSSTQRPRVSLADMVHRGHW